jgi:serine/threonine protein kinase/tetratricopeptide (TPR) repeat protein
MTHCQIETCGGDAVDASPKKARELFLAAIKLPGAEREAYLREACGEDQDLYQRVSALLEAQAEIGSVHQPPTHTVEQPLTESPGTVIGSYKLIEPIGEGGMGTVWLAQQTEPVKRLVAVKLIKAGMDSPQVIARFAAERQALALMDHANIARVLDAGMTGVGRPYFVMDLVKGMPITRYCDEHHLTPRQRLELFIPVCQAVQHAHQKGIIHRDLKPSNVLVAVYDGKPVPKVIDFGVAKAAGQSLTDKTLVTGFGNIVGTLEYMSPEQAEINQPDIDTRSDIYSLGVLLYELLVGSPPFTKKEMEKAGMLEMLRVIREQEPSRPSTKLSTAEGLPTLAANRGTEPAKLTKQVRGELDWIVMKCLEKDRSRRYETANGLAMEVQRYLADEPVVAGPPSASYRLRKFVQRNKGPVLAAMLVLVALVGGIIGTTWGMVRAEWAWQAEGERAEAEKQANTLAQKRLRQVETGSDILASVFYDLDPMADEKPGKLRAVLGDRLLRAAEQLEGETVGDPRLVAGLQDRLGRSLLHLGFAERAIPLFARARASYETSLSPDHPATLITMNDLANAYRDAGKLDQALPLFQETLKLRKIKLGPAHRATLTSMNDLALAYADAGKLDQAVLLHEETLKLRKATLAADHPDTLTSMNNLATAYARAGKLDQAVLLSEETFKLCKDKKGPLHATTLISMSNLAAAYRAVGKLDQALPLFEDSLKLMKSELGTNHPNTLNCMGCLAWAYRDAGKLEESERLWEETIKLRRATQGADHPRTLFSMNNLAVGYVAAGKLDQALPLLEETLKLTKAKLGADNPNTLTCMSNLAWCYRVTGKRDQALSLLRLVAAGIEKRHSVHEHDAGTGSTLIAGHEQMPKFDHAEMWQRNLLKQHSGMESPGAAELAVLGRNLFQLKKYTEAESIFRQSLAIQAKKNSNTRLTFLVQSMLGGALLGQKRYGDAELLLLEGYRGMTRDATTPIVTRFPHVTEAVERLIQLYDAWPKPDEAAKWRKQLQAHKMTLPRSFSWDYTFQPEPGVRLWSRADNGTFIERFPSGKQQKFKLVAPDLVANMEGVIVQLENSKLQTFIPYIGQKEMSLRMRGNEKGQWQLLGKMKNVE